MARTAGDAIPVMESGSRPEETPVKTAAKSGPRHRHAGPYGASFDGTDEQGKPVRGLTIERRWTRPGVHPYDEIVERSAASVEFPHPHVDKSPPSVDGRWK